MRTIPQTLSLVRGTFDSKVQFTLHFSVLFRLYCYCLQITPLQTPVGKTSKRKPAASRPGQLKFTEENEDGKPSEGATNAPMLNSLVYKEVMQIVKEKEEVRFCTFVIFFPTRNSATIIKTVRKYFLLSIGLAGLHFSIATKIELHIIRVIELTSKNYVPT